MAGNQRENIFKKLWKRPFLLIGVLLGVAAIAIGVGFLITGSIIFARDAIALCLLLGAGSSAGVGVTKGVRALVQRSKDQTQAQSDDRERNRNPERTNERTNTYESTFEEVEEVEEMGPLHHTEEERNAPKPTAGAGRSNSTTGHKTYKVKRNQ